MSTVPTRRGVALAVSASAALALAGCKDTTSGFNGQVYPITTTSLELPPPASAGDPCSVGINTVPGGAPGYSFAEARACIHAPLAQVWAALQLPDAVDIAYYGDRDETPRCDARVGVTDKYPVSFRLHQVPKTYSSFDYDVTWAEWVLLGTDPAPQEVAISYNKTWGTAYVERLQGSMLLKEASGWTTIEAVRQIKAPKTDGQMMEGWLRDWFAALQAQVAGTPVTATCPITN
jgi:hypothetical protein